jgi:DNA-binding response OmpR family regulator
VFLRRFREQCSAPRVLVAEDDPAMRNLIVAALRKDGLEVVEARDGNEFFEAIEAAVHVGGRRSPPLSLVVSDVRMPGLSGLDVLCILRAGRWDVPVILISAFSSPAIRSEAHDLDAWAVLDKPFALDELRSLSRAALTHRRVTD